VYCVVCVCVCVCVCPSLSVMEKSYWVHATYVADNLTAHHNAHTSAQRQGQLARVGTSIFLSRLMNRILVTKCSHVLQGCVQVFLFWLPNSVFAMRIHLPVLAHVERVCDANPFSCPG
jgi:hypothetical protein